MSKSRNELVRAEKIAYWKPKIEAWRATDKSIRKFCQENNEDYDQFKYWRCVMEPDISLSSKPVPAQVPEFIEVKTSTLSSVQKSSHIEPDTIKIHHPSGLSLSIPLQTPETTLAVLFKILGEHLC